MDVQTVDGHVVWITYTPSRGAAWAFLVMFAFASVGHFVLMCPYRASYFIPMVIGGISMLSILAISKEPVLTSCSSGDFLILRPRLVV